MQILSKILQNQKNKSKCRAKKSYSGGIYKNKSSEEKTEICWSCYTWNGEEKNHKSQQTESHKIWQEKSWNPGAATPVRSYIRWHPALMSTVRAHVVLWKTPLDQFQTEYKVLYGCLSGWSDFADWWMLMDRPSSLTLRMFWKASWMILSISPSFKNCRHSSLYRKS